ncbi:glycosyltransferase [Cellulomonas rhizosphaerae]|uniref:glycosyltransferase n=1 Tax=Cellulomonas rhizosphaerae TaxID=2293719 RepID=UPI001314ED3D|nr:glycosyltransferase [Cellulomonas rhizosphaerae]
MSRRARGLSAATSAPPSAGVAALLDMRIMDAGFYGAQVGRKFATRRAAAEHYEAVGTRRGLRFHPLISAAFMPVDVRTGLREGQVAEFVAYLFSPAGVDRPWSTLFDPRRLPPGSKRAPGLPGLEALVVQVADFFRTLTPESDLPPRPVLGRATITWEDARRALVAAARRNRAQRALTKLRVTTTWDDAAEQAWIDRLAPVDSSDLDGPLVSVVMPVWNRADRVLDAIASVQGQTLTQWELVVVDDGSEDDSLAVLRAASAADPRIVVVAAEHHGVAAARNTGLEAVRGRYVAFLDSDNSWRPHFLATMVSGMQADGLRSAYSGARLVRDDEVIYRAFRGGLAHLMVINHIDLNVLVVDAVLARATGGFDTSLRRWVDHDFAIRVARLTEPVLLPFIGCDYDDAMGATDRITTTEHDNWQFVVLGNAYVDWDGVRATVADRVQGRVSVVMPAYQDYAMTTEAVAAIVKHSDGIDVEIVVVDNGSRPGTSLELAALALAYPQVVLIRLPRNMNFAIGSNVGFAASTGELVCFLNNDTGVRAGWLEPLVARIAQPDVRGVQPLLVYPDGTVQAAGTVFPVADAMPIHLIAGHPLEDAEGVAELRFSAVTAAALLMRATEVAELRGFDPVFVNGAEDVDLCLRASRDLGGYFAVEPAGVVEHMESKSPGRSAGIAVNRRIFLDRWRGQTPGPELGHYAALGLEVVQIATAGEDYPTPRPVVMRRPRNVTVAGRVRPSLRWNIKNAAIPGPGGDVWGDTHFIDALGSALRRHGQEVVTSRHDAHATPQAVIDDVNLVIRGLDRVQPHPGKVNVLWVISHPDDVTVDEVLQYDIVFAASVPWAAQMSQRSGRPVLPLLQATDAERFHPLAADAARGDDVVFVGQARRNTPREIVMDALDAGVPVRIWGPRWQHHVDAKFHEGVYMPNEQLGSLYRHAGFVLNDHWAAMAADGFISNRVFDAVAAGARVISDHVEGIEETFGGAVQVYRGSADLARLISEDPFPDVARRVEIAHEVRAAHSFDHRAEQLLEAVLSHRAATAPSLQVALHAPHASVRSEVEVREAPRRCVYSALFGDYERPSHQPAFAGDPIDKILFTDDPNLRSDDWEVRLVSRVLPADPGRSSRWPKLLPHRALPDHDVSLYIDNSVGLTRPPSEVLDVLLDDESPFALVEHSYRGAVAEEMDAVVAVKFDDPARIREQEDHYRVIAPAALSAQTLWGGMLARRHHDPLVVAAMEIWWEQVLRYSRRDQLSLPYALQAAGLVPHVHRFDNRVSELHEWPTELGRDRTRAFTA